VVKRSGTGAILLTGRVIIHIFVEIFLIYLIGSLKLKKMRMMFTCQNCGYQSPKWLGRCPSCSQWNCFVEERAHTNETIMLSGFGSMPVSIDTIEADETDRLISGIKEMDRVLGGGIVTGSATLIGGDPGIGKSTLLLQVLQNIAAAGYKVLYISGEESARQISMRGKRIGADSSNLIILIEISLESIQERIKEISPAVVVIDSIQTMYSSFYSSAPGSVTQVRETSEKIILQSKQSGIPLFLIGHVTKDGSIAGPRVLEHMVDTVLYFEGDSGLSYRIVRAVKNRYGPTNEIGVFEMRQEGLFEIENPSAHFLSERPSGASGSVVTASIEGTRPILVEVQSLVRETSLGIPRRTTIGVDHNRVALLAAVIDRVCGFQLSNYDIYINVAGGVKVAEPATDLAIISSLASSFLDRPVDPETIVFGEVGLTGEVRGVGQFESRLKEAGRMGFNRAILPKNALRGQLFEKGIKPIGISSIGELAEYLF
jgi:DNA repair protein RadA/Sms